MYHSTLECDPMVLSYIHGHRHNTQHSVAEFIVDFSVVLQFCSCSDRPNSGQLIYHNMKGFLCSIDTQNSMDS